MLAPLTAAQTCDRARAALQRGQGAGLPELLKLIEALTTNLADVTIAEIADLIEQDAAVMARLLMVANTIVHNPNIAKLGSVHHAIHQVGFQSIRSLAVSLMLIENTGGRTNPPEQRQAAAQALCAGLLAQAYARNQGTVDPDEAFACAALRQFIFIVLAGISVEHYRAAQAAQPEKSEEAAFEEQFGVTPLALARQLLATSRLPEEVMACLRDCRPESVGELSVSTISRLIGIADLSGRMSRLALTGPQSATLFDERSRELSRHYDFLLPGVSHSVDRVMELAHDRVATFTQGSRVSNLPGMDRLKSRVASQRKDAEKESGKRHAGAAGHPHPGPVPTAGSAGNPLAGKSIVLATPSAPGTDPAPMPAAPVSVSGPADEPVAPAPPTNRRHRKPPTPWEKPIRTVRDDFSADVCWIFLQPPGTARLTLLHGLGEPWRRLHTSVSLRPDERSVFGICLQRRENVVIHDTGQTSLLPYLPVWLRTLHPTLGAFMLLPLGKRLDDPTAIALIGWHRAHRLQHSPALTELARHTLAAALEPAAGRASPRAA